LPLCIVRASGSAPEHCALWYAEAVTRLCQHAAARQTGPAKHNAIFTEGENLIGSGYVTRGSPRRPLPCAMAVLQARLLQPFVALGRYSLLLMQAFASLGEFRQYRKNLFDQMVRIGIESIPIVALAAAFSGAVTTVQTAYQLVSPLIPKTIIGSIVAPSMILELGAVVTGFILAGRVGARIAAELGTMRVTEQIDALEAMGLNSIGYLIVPRVIAGIVMFPVLYIVACFVGISGGLLVAEFSGYLSPAEFIDGAREFFQPFDPVFGVIKSIVFGFVITSISCYKGYYTAGGAEGVGQSTTQAAVSSCVYLLLADLILAATLL
jgi:phospholipid/cholesterol/gamma-HCH transport system permease protein